MADVKVLQKAIDDAGYNGSAVVDRANWENTKTDLRERTAEAKQIGLCGVPSYRVFKRKGPKDAWRQVGDIVWGQDEIAVVEDFIAGWDGETGGAAVQNGSEGGNKPRL